MPRLRREAPCYIPMPRAPPRPGTSDRAKLKPPVVRRPGRRPVRSSQAVSQHDRVGLFPNRIICIRSADMLTPPAAANSRQEPGGPGPLLAFDNPGSGGSGISLPGSGTVPEHIRSVRVLRAVPGLSKLAVLSWRSSRGLWLSDTFAAACL